MGVPEQAQNPGGQLTDGELRVGGPYEAVRAGRIRERLGHDRAAGRQTVRGRKAAVPLIAVLSAALVVALAGWDGASGQSADGPTGDKPLVLASVLPWGGDGATVFQADTRTASTVGPSLDRPRAPILSSRVWVASGMAATDQMTAKAVSTVVKGARGLPAAAPGLLLAV